MQVRMLLLTIVYMPFHCSRRVNHIGPDDRTATVEHGLPVHMGITAKPPAHMVLDRSRMLTVPS
ncbi:hypothetical protein COO72_05100 [Bifidobacterium callitrichos]|nr:hypothetical protein COO72_05100 [Bifidobacterium callitrichos]